MIVKKGMTLLGNLLITSVLVYAWQRCSDISMTSRPTPNVH